MKWSTHIRISRNVLREIDPNNAYLIYEKTLLNSCIKPDKNDRGSAHHYGREDTIEHHVVEARKAFLREDLRSCFINLGYAFHYIQDNWTYLPARSRSHDNWEKWIDDSSYASDAYIKNKMREYSKSYLVYLDYLNGLTQDVKGKNETLTTSSLKHPGVGKPWIDLNLAYRVSLKVAKSVLQEKQKPGLQGLVDDKFSIFYLRLQEVENLELEKLLLLKNRISDARSKNGNLKYFYRIYSYYLQARRSLVKNSYVNNKHLKKEVKNYYRSINEINHDHLGWYQYDIPELTFDYIVNQRNEKV